MPGARAGSRFFCLSFILNGTKSHSKSKGRRTCHSPVSLFKAHLLRMKEGAQEAVAEWRQLRSCSSVPGKVLEAGTGMTQAAELEIRGQREDWRGGLNGVIKDNFKASAVATQCRK